MKNRFESEYNRLYPLCFPNISKTMKAFRRKSEDIVVLDQPTSKRRLKMEQDSFIAQKVGQKKRRKIQKMSPLKGKGTRLKMEVLDEHYGVAEEDEEEWRDLAAV